jgi:hypothetical protein
MNLWKTFIPWKVCNSQALPSGKRDYKHYFSPWKEEKNNINPVEEKYIRPIFGMVFPVLEAVQQEKRWSRVIQFVRLWSQDVVVSVATGHGLNDLGSIPGSSFPSSPPRPPPDRLWTPPSFLSGRCKWLFPQVLKRLDHEITTFTLSEVKRIYVVCNSTASHIFMAPFY